MKKIIDYCDVCEKNIETTKCGCCGCSLCGECALIFPITIGKYNMCHHKSFCENCFPKIQLNKAKKDYKFLEKIKKEILTKLNEKIEKISFKCSIKRNDCR